MDQTIRFCKSPDGVRLAYATIGSGYPLVFVTGWLSHLELDWEWEHQRRFWETLAERHTVIRYDKRGIGLSDRKVEDFSLEAQVSDLQSVVSAVDIERAALMGHSAGGPITLAYSHAHPEVVSRMILYGTYASGKYVAMSELSQALMSLVRADWDGLGSLTMADLYAPGAPTDVREATARYFRACAEADAAYAQATTVGAYSVKHLLKDIQIPALVLHKTRDRPVPFELGRRLARDLPNARFIPIDGDLHLFSLENTKIVLEAVLEFLGGAKVGRPAPSQPGSSTGIITRREKDVLRLIAAGRSNRQIAEELTISINTADRHVSNILTKIAASNRAEAASYAVRSGIAS